MYVHIICTTNLLLGMHVDVNVLDHQWNLVYNSTDTCTGIQFVLIIINFRGW